MVISSMKSTFRGLLNKENGNFAIMAALAVPVLFMAGSLAVDTTNALSMKVRMQNAVDSAALATATRLTNEEDLGRDEAEAFALKFLNGQLREDFSAFNGLSITPSVTVTPVEDGGRTVWNVAINLSGTQTLTPMARLLGQNKLTVGVSGKSVSAGETQGSFSMALVLDRSGSMDWKLDGERKINILKVAVGNLLDQFVESDPNREHVRVGASSYNNRLSDTQSLRWNPEKTREFTDELRASGGTDSTDAFEWAYEAVIHSREDQNHAQKTGQVPKRFILFMTDGSNNRNSADRSTGLLCDRAKDDGIEVYSVAFAAPSKGKALLSYCASSPEHFFDAQNSAELIEAFKDIGNSASKVVSRLTG